MNQGGYQTHMAGHRGAMRNAQGARGRQLARDRLESQQLRELQSNQPEEEEQRLREEVGRKSQAKIGSGHAGEAATTTGGRNH